MCSWPSDPHLCLWQVADLLEPRTFTEQTHEWVAVHNRIQRGQGSEEDKAMVNRARECAMNLGVKGIVAKGDKAYGMPKVLKAVLEQHCAMKPKEMVVAQVGGAGNRGKRTLTSWQIYELASGCAEKMLVWHERLGKLVPAAEYRSREQQHINEQAERMQQRRLAQAQAEYDAEMGDAEALDLGAGHPRPAARPVVAPYDPNVMYEPFDGAMIKECLDDWRGDQRKRDAALAALLTLSAARAKTPGVTDDDLQLQELDALCGSLRKWAERHAVVAALDASLPPPDAEGRRSLRVEYDYKAGGDAAGRRYANGEWKRFCDGDPRCLSLQGMPRDLRPKLTGKWLHDIDGVKSDPSIIVNEARRAGLPPDDFKCHFNFISYPDEWIKRVAEFECHAAGWDATPEVMSELKASIKRWPNRLDNGSGTPALLEKAGLPADTPTSRRGL